MRCGSCDQEKVNVGSSQPDWVCKNNRCVKYARYIKVKCGECGCAPVDVEGVMGTTAAKFRCPNDHIFKSEAASWPPMPTPGGGPAPAEPPTAAIRSFLERMEAELKAKKGGKGGALNDAQTARRNELKNKRSELLKELEAVVLELAKVEGGG